jgi:hypothetical protein
VFKSLKSNAQQSLIEEEEKKPNYYGRKSGFIYSKTYFLASKKYT